MAELCKHLPVEMVEQYRRGAYVRYAINSMKDIELHDATDVKTTIDKGGRCNATQSDVTRMASLSQTRVNSDYALNFDNDKYNMDADMADFHYFCVFLVYKIKGYAKITHWERNYLISNWRGGKETRFRGICFLPDKKTLRSHGGGSTGSDVSFDFRAWRKQTPVKRINSMLYVWRGLGSRRVPTQHYGLDGAYVSNFDSTAAFGSDQKLTLGNIIDGGGVPFQGTIAAMELYMGITEGVPRPIKKEIMKSLCRDYGVDIDQGD